MSLRCYRKSNKLHCQVNARRPRGGPRIRVPAGTVRRGTPCPGLDIRGVRLVPQPHGVITVLVAARTNAIRTWGSGTWLRMETASPRALSVMWCSFTHTTTTPRALLLPPGDRGQTSFLLGSVAAAEAGAGGAAGPGAQPSTASPCDTAQLASAPCRRVHASSTRATPSKRARACPDSGRLQ